MDPDEEEENAEPPPPPPPPEWETRDVRDFNSKWATEQIRALDLEYEKEWDAKQFLPAPHNTVIKVPFETVELRFLKRSGGVYHCVKSKEIKHHWELSWLPPKKSNNPKDDDQWSPKRKKVIDHTEYDIVRLCFGMAVSNLQQFPADEVAGDACTLSIVKPSMRRLTLCIPQTSETCKKLESYLRKILMT
ncbi:unnamed protein product [Amoebophrya sp. A120]|nr:unnamed protein product [Amoebophrya sp. A120]|eukprot:GSA120T00019099001.1